METAKERLSSANSLVCLLQGMVGISTTIELRSEITVQGTVAHVDHCMNTTVTDATYTLLNGDITRFEQLFIHGNQIRYVHIPEGVDVMSTIRNQVSVLTRTVSKEGTYQRQRVGRDKMERLREEREMAREYKLGRGRAKQSQQ